MSEPTGATALPFASDAWFAEARRLTASLPVRPGNRWRLQFDAARDDGSHLRWHQVAEDGQITAWEPGDVDGPDLEVRWSEADARRVYRQELAGTEALAAARLVDAEGHEGSAPPLDISETDEISRLPEVPGATLSVQFEFANGPFGLVTYWQQFDDGQVTTQDFGRIEEPDVTIGISWLRMVKVRTGEMSILEALENGGKIDGALGPIMLVAGLEESPELHAAEAACGPAGTILARVSETTSTPEYLEAMSALAAVTE